jgi:asparaginyl-tRNA synthetase
MNVLAPGIGEIIGGSQREERLEVLDQAMTERGIDKEHYAWYRDLRRYDTVPHAGFGLGFERTLACVTGLANVRDGIPFQRTPLMQITGRNNGFTLAIIEQNRYNQGKHYSI